MELNEVLELVKSYLKINKDLSMLQTGDGSFIKNYNKDTHRIHGKVDTLGGITARCTHNSPNITQAPKDKRFRELLTVPDDKVLIDVDASALIILAHFKQGEFRETLNSLEKDNPELNSKLL